MTRVLSLFLLLVHVSLPALHGGGFIVCRSEDGRDWHIEEMHAVCGSAVTAPGGAGNYSDIGADCVSAAEDECTDIVLEIPGIQSKLSVSPHKLSVPPPEIIFQSFGPRTFLPASPALSCHSRAARVLTGTTILTC